VAVLEACRRPPAVLPVQAPAAVRVPEHAEARVAMPFGREGAQGEAESSLESELLSVVEMPRSASEEASASAESREPLGNVRLREAGVMEDTEGASGADVAGLSSVEQESAR